MANMTKTMEAHPTFEPGESLVEAVYGLGQGVLKAADLAGGLANTLIGRTSYADEHESAVEGRDEHGFASLAEGNGVLALTNQRVLFYKKATVVGRPKTITAEIAVQHVTAARYDKPMLIVGFDDGSIVGLHVPRNQKPDAFVAAITGLSLSD